MYVLYIPETFQRSSKSPLKEKNIFQPESFGGEFSYHPFRDQFGRRCSIGKYSKPNLNESLNDSVNKTNLNESQNGFDNKTNLTDSSNEPHIKNTLNESQNNSQDESQIKTQNESELLRSKSQNLLSKPIASWNICISSVVKNSRGFANSNQFFDGVTKLRIENFQIGYTAHLYDQILTSE